MQKKTKVFLGISLMALLAIGQVSFAAETDKDQTTTTNGMTNMMKMMDNHGMSKMMDAMNSPEGQEMMKSCSKFLESYNEKEDWGKTK